MPNPYLDLLNKFLAGTITRQQLEAEVKKLSGKKDDLDDIADIFGGEVVEN